MAISDNKYLMLVIMRSAGDLVAMYESSLSDGDIKRRMLRISDDLVYAVNQCDGED